jgi:hypothetical protein
MDFVNGTSSYFLFYGRKPLCELATGQGMLKQALLLFLVTFEVYMVDIPEEYYGKNDFLQQCHISQKLEMWVWDM